jgi:hypothetical protein
MVDATVNMQTQSTPTPAHPASSPFALTGGILSIVGGAFGLFLSLYFGVFAAIFIFTGNTDLTFFQSGGIIVTVVAGIMALFFLAAAALAIVGGIIALRRRKWGLALAGAIAAIFTSGVLGILATVFVSISKKDFKS